MKCKKCGADLKLSDEVCPYCGAVNYAAKRHILSLIHIWFLWSIFYYAMSYAGGIFSKAWFSVNYDSSRNTVCIK